MSRWPTAASSRSSTSSTTTRGCAWRAGSWTWSRPTTSSGSCTNRPRPGAIRPRSSPTTGSSSPRRTRFGFEGVRSNKSCSRLGITAKHSRPYHPQTCGKVERFHQTLKKFVAAQKGIETKKQLQRAIDRFVAYYNDVRPHRGVGRRTPRSVFGAREKAEPTAPMIKINDRRLRLDKVDSAGSVTLRHQGRLHHIGIGRALCRLAPGHAHRRPRHRSGRPGRLTTPALRP